MNTRTNKYGSLAKKTLIGAAAIAGISSCAVPNQVQGEWIPGARLELGKKFARVTTDAVVRETFQKERSEWGDVLFDVVNVQKGKYYFAFNNTYLDQPLSYSSFCAKQGDVETRYYLGMENDVSGNNKLSTADFQLVVRKVGQKLQECAALPNL